MAHTVIEIATDDQPRKAHMGIGTVSIGLVSPRGALSKGVGSQEPLGGSLEQLFPRAKHGPSARDDRGFGV